MMNQRGVFRIGFIEELTAQILEMRYTQGKLSMFVLLPSRSADNVKGLEEVSLHALSLQHVSCKISGEQHDLPSTILG